MSEPIKTLIKGILVDAGCIAIADAELYQQYGPIKGIPHQMTGVHPGEYRVEWKLHEPHWRDWDEAKGSGLTLTMNSGIIIIGDPCHSVNDKLWDKFLDDTNYLDESSADNVLFINTGGDGSFTLEITFTPKGGGERQ